MNRQQIEFIDSLCGIIIIASALFLWMSW